MIKECSVIYSNDLVTVVRFDNIDVQFPSIHKNDKTVFVSYEEGRYSIVNKDTCEKSSFSYRNKKTGGNKIKKKTTIDEDLEKTDLSCEEEPCNGTGEH